MCRYDAKRVTGNWMNAVRFRHHRKGGLCPLVNSINWRMMMIYSIFYLVCERQYRQYIKINKNIKYSAKVVYNTKVEVKHWHADSSASLILQKLPRLAPGNRKENFFKADVSYTIHFVLCLNWPRSLSISPHLCNIQSHLPCPVLNLLSWSQCSWGSDKFYSLVKDYFWKMLVCVFVNVCIAPQ